MPELPVIYVRKRKSWSNNIVCCKKNVFFYAIQRKYTPCRLYSGGGIRVPGILGPPKFRPGWRYMTTAANQSWVDRAISTAASWLSKEINNIELIYHLADLDQIYRIK